jgi:hypothetical protein
MLANVTMAARCHGPRALPALLVTKRRNQHDIEKCEALCGFRWNRSPGSGLHALSGVAIDSEGAFRRRRG